MCGSHPTSTPSSCTQRSEVTGSDSNTKSCDDECLATDAQHDERGVKLATNGKHGGMWMRPASPFESAVGNVGLSTLREWPETVGNQALTCETH